MTRSVLLAAMLLVIARGAGAQVDTSGRRTPPPADSTALRDTVPRDTTARDTIPHLLPALPPAFVPGPLPRGSRYTFTADSFVFSDAKTLSDLLAHIPGVYVARGGLYGQAEAVLYGGRGPAALEVYWDGVPCLPLGRDSVYLDPARIPLAPLERVDVIVLPATLRVYLVTLRQQSTAPVTEVGIATGVLNTAGYRGTFLKRWRSGVGLSLVADWNDITGAQSSASTSFHDIELWLKTEYVPNPRVGTSLQIVSSDWDRRGNASPLVDPFRSKRVNELLRIFLASRSDGFGPRVDLTLANTTVSRDTAVANRTLSQASLGISSLWQRAAAALTARFQGSRSPLQLEAQASWNPVFPITLSADARHARYDLGRSGSRAHLAAGVVLPFGLSIQGDAAWGRDLQAPARSDDSVQATSDVFGAIRWRHRWMTLGVGAARRGAFTPTPAFLTGLRGVSSLGPTPATNYLTIQGAIHIVPGLELSGWYFHPVRGGGDFEPPRHARYAATFYSKFWRVYRSGIFALRAEAAGESWTGGGGAGLVRDTIAGTVTQLELVGATFVNFNVQIRIAGVTIFWAIRNARSFHGSYLPGVDYPSNYQTYGVRWRFTN